MPSGDPILEILAVLPPASSAAGLRYVPGAGTPGELVPVWLFDDTAVEYLDFLCALSNKYGGGGLTLTLPFSTTSSTDNTKAVAWAAACYALTSSVDFDTTAKTYAYQQTNANGPNAVGKLVFPTIAFADGSQMDNWAAGGLGLIRVKRIGSDATNDTLVGDAELWTLYGKET